MAGPSALHRHGRTGLGQVFALTQSHLRARSVVSGASLTVSFQ